MNEMDARTDGDGGCRVGWDDRLSEYLDGDLTPPERLRFEQHLAVCPPCAATLDELGEVVSRARALDRPSEPGHDLWPAVQRRLGPRPGRFLVGRRIVRSGLGTAWPVPRLALAATLVLALVAAVVWLMPARLGSPPGRSATPAAVRGAATDADREFYDSVADLRRVVRSALTLDPHVAEVLEQNLSVLDVAIAEYRDALADQPEDTRLAGRLTAARQRKLALLRQAAALAAQGAN